MSATLVKDATLTGGTAQRRPENAHLLRDKLLARIEDDLETHRLVMLKAPPGYGKSVVMTQLEARLHEKGAAVRISLGLAHGAPAEFARSVIEALGNGAIEAVERAGEGALAPLVARSAARYAAEAPLTLLIDQYHKAAGPGTDRLLAALVESAPANLRFVLAVRATPTQGTAELRLAGDLAEFGVQDLRFSRAEIAAYFKDRIGEDDFAALEAKTRGWPAALRLVELDAARRGGLAEAICTLGPDNPDLAEYFEQTIINGLAPDVAAFLADISILGAVSAGAADAVRDRDDGAQLIARLADLNLFMTPAGDASKAFRLHPLFADYLASHLAASRSAGDLEIMHRRAARYFELHGEKIEALQHAVEAGDDDLIVNIVRDSGGAGVFWVSRDFETAQRAMDRLQRKFPEKALRLLPVYTFFMGRSGRLEEARRNVGEGRRMLERLGDEISESERETIRADLILIDATIALYTYEEENLEWLVSELERIRYRGVSADPVYLGIVHNMLGLVQFRMGEMQATAQLFEDAGGHYERAGSYWSVVYSSIHQSCVMLESGEAHEAATAVQRAYLLFRQHARQDDALGEKVDVMAARLQYLAAASPKDLIAARQLLADALPRIVANGEYWAELLIEAYRSKAALAYANYGLAGAMETLAHGIGLARSRGIERLVQGLTGMQIRIASLAGDPALAERLAEDIGADFDALNFAPPGFGWQNDAEIAFGLIRLDIARGDARQALERIGRVERAADGAGLHLTALKCAVLRCLALFEARQEAEAAAKLRQILPVLNNGYRAILLEEGALARQMLDDAASRIARSVERDALLPAAVEMRSLAHAFMPPEVAAEPKAPTGPAMEVLRRIAEGRRPKDIAPELEITVDGVNHHLKSMRKKMGVTSTPALVAEAIRMGFLEDVALAPKYRD